MSRSRSFNRFHRYLARQKRRGLRDVLPQFQDARQHQQIPADSSDDEDDEGLELSETMTVAGVEYFFTEQDGQTILFTKAGEPVGIYDADTDTVQECEFDDE